VFAPIPAQFPTPQVPFRISITTNCCGWVTDLWAACLYESANFESTLCRVAFNQEDWETKMKKIAFATAAVTMLLTGAASAADLAARPYTKAPVMPVAVYNWTGFYIGANGGGGWSHKCWDNFALGGVVVPPVVAEGCHDATGGTVGGQIGYRWQATNWVFGLEAQGNWADFSGQNVSQAFGGLATNRTKIDAFGLFTGQIGYAFNNVLLYVKGGGAVTDNKFEGLALGTVIDRNEETRWGGTVGAGVEFAFAPNWSAAVEYDHLFMDTNNRQFTSVFPVGGINTRNDDIKQDADLVTVRVNYRFGGPFLGKY
jgi:outer membrane immunogenic protein